MADNKNLFIKKLKKFMEITGRFGKQFPNDTTNNTVVAVKAHGQPLPSLA